MIEVFKALEERVKENKESVLVTIIEMKGSTPGKAGFKMLVGPEGRIAGTVGGGGVEFYAVNKSKEMLQNGRGNFTETLIMKDTLTGKENNNIEVKKDDKVEINALCGGEVTLFYELYKSSKTLYLFGAGHVGQAVAKLAFQLGYYVVVFDNRQNILDEIPGEACNQKKLVDLPNLSLIEKNHLALDEQSYTVILTHNHINDLQVLEFIYKNYPGMKYIGMIGSKRKVKEGISFIKKKFDSKLDLRNLYAPIGSEIGGDSPNEIALSIITEIQAISYGKQINHLRLNYNEIK